MIDPNASSAKVHEDPEHVIAVLLAVLHKTTKLRVDTERQVIDDPTQAVVAVESKTPRLVVERQKVSQVRHEYTFYIYTKNDASLPVDRLVG